MPLAAAEVGGPYARTNWKCRKTDTIIARDNFTAISGEDKPIHQLPEYAGERVE